MIRNSLLLLLLALAGPLPAVEIIAHRGASHDAPENTLAAFQLGWKQSADAVELDIYLTKDGRIAALHDKTTTRTTGVEGAIAEMTLAQLQALDAGSWKGSEWAGEKIPTLEQALLTLPEGKQFFIEIKCGPEVLPELKRVLDGSGKAPEQLVIIAFDFDTIRQAKQLIPGSPAYWLVSPKKDSEGQQPPVEEMIAKAKSAGLEGLNLNYKFAIDEAFLAKVRDADLKLFVWTVNDADVARRLADLGIDGITTDRPGLLREQLLPSKAVETGRLPAAEAKQASAAEGPYVYAIDNRVVVKYDRATGQRLAQSTGEAHHLNSGFFWEGRLYCAHSNYPATPAKSEIMVLDPESMVLISFKDFGDYRGSLTWAVREGGYWWCNFAHYKEENARTVLVKLDDDWKEHGAWTYPPEVVADLGKASISGGLWLNGHILATGHDHRVIYQLRLPENGSVLELINVLPSPFPGQGIAVDPVTGGLLGIDRAKREIVFAELRRETP